MPVNVTINGTPLTCTDVTVEDALDQRSTAAFVVSEASGVIDFANGEQVSITDNVLGTCFTGYVNDDTVSFKAPELVLTHTVNCIDQHYLADKRVASGADDDKNMSNHYAGDDVVYLVDNYLSDEGVTASYARQFATTATDFRAGILAGVVAADNVDNGDLELAPAGSPVSRVDSTAANWNAGTRANTAGASNALTLAPTPTIKLTSTCNGSAGSRLFQQIWTGNYTIASGDTLSYSMWIADSSPAIQAYVHLHCSNGANTGGLTDFIFLNEENQDLSGNAKNQWYARTVDLTSIAGGHITNAYVCFDAASSGEYTAYFHDIKVVNGATTKATIFGSSLNSNVRGQDFGYNQTTCQVVSAYDPPLGSRISPSTDLTPVGIAKAGNIFWQASVPTDTTLVISTSIDGGVTWVPQTSSSLIAGMLAGASMRGLSLLTKVEMAITGNDPTSTPSLSTLQWTINPSYAATKSDVMYSKHSSADFSAGTLTNTLAQASNGGVTLNGFWRSWYDQLFPNQTLYGAASPTQYSYHRAFVLTSSTGFDVRSRFDFAGNAWNILDMSISHDIPTSLNNANNGLVYGTTNWGNANNSYAYTAWVSATEVQLAKGTNSTGAGALTSLGTFTFPVALTANSWHTLRVQWNGTSSTQNGIPAHTHNIYVDGVLYLSVVDATYTAAGYVAARHYNNTGGAMQGHFSNFSIVQSYANATWLSPNYSLNAVGTCGSSQLTWNASVPSSSALIAETTIDGGSTWQPGINGGPIAGLSNGVNLAGKNLKVRFTFTEDIGQETIVQGFTAWITSQYSASGSRIAPGLNLTSAGRAGSTLVSWNALVPEGTALDVDTSLNRINWTNVGSGAQGGVEIAGITAQADPIEDTFEADTSSFYLSTSQTGGAEASWTWDTANSRLEATDGTTAFLLFNGLSDDDVDIVVDMDTSDAGGLVWRVFDTSNFYDLVVADASSASPNQVILYRVANNTRQTLATTSITWTRGTPRRIRVTMIGPSVTVSFDGTQILTYTDNFPLAAGKSGLRTNTYGGQSAANFYFFRIQPQGDSVLGMDVFTRTRFTSPDPTVTPQLLDLTVSVRSPDIGSGAFIPSTTYSVLNGSTNTIAADLDDLARQSNYWCRIDQHKAMKFQPHNGTLAPFVLTDLDMLDTYEVSVKNFGDLYRNTPWILGGTDTIFSDREQFTTDGIAQSFTVDYPIESMVSVTAGVKSYTFGLKGVDTGRDFYFQVGNNTINQDTSQTPLPPGLKLNPVYYGQVNVVATAQDAAEVAARAALEETSGIVEVAETAQGLNRAGATQLAASREIQYTPLSKQLTCTTLRTGLAVGQLLSVFSQKHRLTDVQMLITNMKTFWKMTKLRGTFDATPFFTITAVSGPLLNEWATVLSGGGH